MRDPFLRKELKKFIRERQPTFLDLREEALRWSEEEERPQHSMPKPSISQEVAVDTPEGNSQCSASSSITPMDKVLEVLQKQQKSLEELTASKSKGKGRPRKISKQPMEWKASESCGGETESGEENESEQEKKYCEGFSAVMHNIMLMEKEEAVTCAESCQKAIISSSWAEITLYLK